MSLPVLLVTSPILPHGSVKPVLIPTVSIAPLTKVSALPARLMIGTIWMARRVPTVPLLLSLNSVPAFSVTNQVSHSLTKETVSKFVEMVSESVQRTSVMTEIRRTETVALSLVQFNMGSDALGVPPILLTLANPSPLCLLSLPH